MALDDALARRVVGVAAGLAVVRQCHEAVLLVPRHAPLVVQAVVLHQRGITIGIVCVMLMSYLRGSSGMIAVFVLIRKVVRLCRLCGVYLLHLGKRLAHATEGHRHFIRCTLRLSVCLYQTIEVVIGVGLVHQIRVPVEFQALKRCVPSDEIVSFIG